MNEIETYKKTPFFIACLDAGVDTEALSSLCCLIQSTNLFDGFDVALKRLHIILPLVKLFAPKINDSVIQSWLHCVNQLVPEIEKDWFRSTITFSIPSRQNSTKRLGARYRTHEFYNALIVDCYDSETENRLTIVLTMCLAVKLLQTDDAEQYSFSNAQLITTCEGVCKATKIGSLWELSLTQLIHLEDEYTLENLKSIVHRCENLNEESDCEYKQGQVDFANALRRLTNNLLKQNNTIPTTTLPLELPTPASPPIKPIVDESENTGFQPLPIGILPVPPNKTANVDLDGLSSDDTDDITPVIHTPPVLAGDIVLSDGSEKLSALYSSYFSELDNQYLPIQWSVLNENEISEVVSYIKSGLDLKASSIDRASQLIIALTLVTGQDFKALQKFRVQTQTNNTEDKNWLIREQDVFYWGHTIPQLTNSYRPDQNASTYLKPVSKALILPLPSFVCQLLSKCIDQNNKTGLLTDILNVNLESLELTAKKKLTELRNKRTNRSTLSRIRNVLFQQLMYINNDEIAALTIIGTEYDRPLSGLYYTSFQVKDLVDQYRSAITQLFSGDNFPSIIKNHNQFSDIGSPLSVSIEMIQKMVNELKNRCTNSNSGTRDLAKIIRAHNDFTNYTLMMLLFSSAHRSVNDPFYSNNCFIPSKNILLITDKLEMQEHEGRSVWLGDIAMSQYRAYLKHLDGLACAIKKYNPDLENNIKSLTQPCLKQTLPFFFYLTAKGWTSIKPSNLKGQLGDAWQLPLNTNRHFLSTQLRQLGVSAEYISYQLGHVRTGQLPHGQFSLLSPDDVGKQLIPALTQLEKSCEWESISGMRPYGKTDFPTNIKISTLPAATFGPALRQKRRDKTNKADAKLVRCAISKVNKINEWKFTDDIPEEFITQVLNEIAINSSDKPIRLIRRHNLFRRFIKIGRHKKKWNSSVPSLMVEVKGEKAPLSSEDGSDIQKLNLIKHEFLRYIGQQFTDNIFPPEFSTNDINQARYWASLRLSALLFGQLCDQGYIDLLDKRVINDIHAHGGKIWINFTKTAHDKSILKFRWLPDELSSVLIIRLHQKIVGTETNFPISSKVKSSVEILIKQICKKIGVNQDEYSANPAEFIIKLVKKDNVLHFPGFVRAYINRDIHSYPLYESAFRRLITGRPLDLKESIAKKEKSINTSLFRIPKERSSSLKKELEALKELRGHISNAQPKSSSQQNDKEKVENDDQSRKTLAADLNDWEKSWKNCSLTMFYLYDWVCWLLKHGTSKKGKIATGTILQYFNTCSTAIIEQCWDLNLTDLDGDELFDVYDQVIDAGIILNRPYRAGRLEEFHRFLMLQHGAALVDFNDIEPSSTEYGADANIVMPDEYEYTIKLLLEDEYLKVDEQKLHALILCLSYRNGLRAGEVVRLLTSDIISENFMLAYIRNNRLGRTKTVNGIRQIPFYDRLNKTEIDLLQHWHKNRLASQAGDKLAPFFTRRLRDNALVIRQSVIERITQALRIATGDPDVKFRNLRHSFATFFTLSTAQQNVDFIDSSVTAKWSGNEEHIADNLTKTIFNQNFPTRKTMYQLAVFMGHGSPQTSIEHYVHCLDILTAAYRPSIPEDLTANEIFTILGYKKNSMGPTLARLNLSAKKLNLVEILPHYLKKKIPPHIKISLARRTINSSIKLPPIANKIEIPPFDVLSNLLIDYTEGADISALAQHYFFEPTIIEQWIKNAISIQSISGYHRFGLRNRSNNGWPVLASEVNEEYENINNNLLRNNAYHIFSKNIHFALSQGVTNLINLTEIWRGTYQRQSTGFYSSSQNDLEKLINELTNFGIELKSIYLEIPNNALDIYQSSIENISKWLDELGVPQENIRFITGDVFVKNSDDLELISRPGVTVCTKYDQEDEASTPKIYYSTEFISYYTFLTSIIIRKSQ